MIFTCSCAITYWSTSSDEMHGEHDWNVTFTCDARNAREARLKAVRKMAFAVAKLCKRLNRTCCLIDWVYNGVPGMPHVHICEKCCRTDCEDRYCIARRREVTAHGVSTVGHPDHRKYHLAITDDEFESWLFNSPTLVVKPFAMGLHVSKLLS